MPFSHQQQCCYAFSSYTSSPSMYTRASPPWYFIESRHTDGAIDRKMKMYVHAVYTCKNQLECHFLTNDKFVMLLLPSKLLNLYTQEPPLLGTLLNGDVQMMSSLFSSSLSSLFFSYLFMLLMLYRRHFIRHSLSKSDSKIF